MPKKTAQSTPAPDFSPNFSYDEVPYESYAYVKTHPDNLYTVGRLLGLSPPDFSTARVLEIGCAAGGNLLPVALEFPKIQCVGIDLSAEEIAVAQRHQKELGLKNIRFEQKDIMEIGPDFGAFDYIICHGVFSWVPDMVREKILTLCRENLSPQGLAMVSFNALPGWHFSGAVREMMKYHAALFPDPKNKVAQARALLQFMSQNINPDLTFMKDAIDNEIEAIKGANDTYVFHDHLASENKAFYLHEFVTLLKENGLQYVGDTEISTLYLKNMGPAVAAQFSKIPDRVRQQQYMDFMNGRRFHMAIITHGAVPLKLNISPDMIFDFYIASLIGPEESNPDIEKPVAFRKKDSERTNLTTSDRLSSAFFVELAKAGAHPVKADDIIARVKEKLGLEDAQPLRDIVRGMGIELVLSGLLELRAAPGSFVDKVSAKPCVYPVARLMAAEAGHAQRMVTGALRQAVITNRFSNLLMTLADGSRSVDEITTEMLAQLKAGTLGSVKEEPTLEGVRALVDQALGNYARCALLVG